MRKNSDIKGVWSNQAGISLIDTMVALGISGMIIAAMSSFMQQLAEETTRITLRGDLVSLQKTIIEVFDCYQSLGTPSQASLPLNCQSYPNIQIRKSNGTYLVGPDSRIGAWRLTAGCAGNKIIFQTSKFNYDPLSQMNPRRVPEFVDPLTGKPDLFRGTSSFCASFFGAGATSDSVPSGAIMNFNRNYCPVGWISRPSAGTGWQMITCEKL